MSVYELFSYVKTCTTIVFHLKFAKMFSIVGVGIVGHLQIMLRVGSGHTVLNEVWQVPRKRMVFW